MIIVSRRLAAAPGRVAMLLLPLLLAPVRGASPQLATPGSAAAEITARVGRVLKIERDRQLMGEDGGWVMAELPSVIEEADREWVQRVLEPTGANAKTCQQRMEAAALLLGRERQRQLLGQSGTSMAELSHVMDQWGVDCAAEAYHRCETRHDLGMVRVFLAIERQRQLLGQESIPVQELIEGCLTFELDWALDSGLDDIWHVKARVIAPVVATLLGGEQPPPVDVELDGPKPLIECMRFNVSEFDPTVRVTNFQLGAHLPSAWEDALEAAAEARAPAVFPREVLPIDEILVQFVPGSKAFTSSMSCPDASMPPMPGGWPEIYTGFDESQFSESSGQETDGVRLRSQFTPHVVTLRFRAPEGEIPQGFLFAVRQYEVAGPVVTHATAMLLHRPKPMPSLNSGPRRTPLTPRTP